MHADFSAPEGRMKFVIHLANQNVQHQTGGPFAAAIFDMDTGQLISVGVNIVVPSHNSCNHAEMVAISLAQQSLQTHHLHQQGSFELVTSCEPCAMCFGAIPWSGIRHLVCAARDADARAIGFDEGPKLPDWQAALLQRGITVETDICRSDAVEILQRYAENQGPIYNAGSVPALKSN